VDLVALLAAPPHMWQRHLTCGSATSHVDTNPALAALSSEPERLWSRIISELKEAHVTAKIAKMMDASNERDFGIQSN